MNSALDRPIVRAMLNGLSVLLVALLAFLVWQRMAASQKGAAAGAPETEPEEQRPNTAEMPPFELAPAPVELASLEVGIPRKIEFETTIPSRPRVEVITYTVQAGDNLFGIAEQFGIKPETVLWGNFETLKDNPQLLSIDQVLNILPTDGTYYQWKEGDTLGSVAAFFEVEPQAILSYPGNDIDLTAVNSETAGIEAGTWLIIEGGKREIKDWGPPAITRSNPASASYYGAGHCGSIYEGAFGTGSFVWPTTERFISGYNYSAIHRGIDIGGSIGNTVFAADSGVVVYAGFSNYGYGNLVVIDHGNGWQTAYAHLDTYAVGCGQSVYQGGYIAGLGSTGNSTGPHLHFEIVYNGSKPNPLDFLR